MSDDSVVIRVLTPDKLKIKDLNGPEMYQALRKIGRTLKADVQKRLSTKGKPDNNRYPKRRTGDMRRAVECVYSKYKKTGKYWVRVQVGTIYSREKGVARRVQKMWYAGPLNYGRKKGDLKAHPNAVEDAKEAHKAFVIDALSDAMVGLLKNCGWKTYK